MTTIVSVRRNGTVVIGGDVQVSLGNTVMKGNARKVHRLYNGKVLAGFAGGTADAFTLLERFEAKLQAHQGNLERAAVELAKDWRTDRALRKLEALLAVADAKNSFIITGNGDVVQPEDDLIAIGSGGAFAQSAARALLDNTELSAKDESGNPYKYWANTGIQQNNGLELSLGYLYRGTSFVQFVRPYANLSLYNFKYQDFTTNKMKLGEL